MDAGRAADRDTRDIYAEAFELTPQLIEGDASHTGEIEISLEPLRQGIRWIEDGVVTRTLVDERFAAYVLPRQLVVGRVGSATYVPGFNEAISEAAILWPQARARWDARRACLVSSAIDGGWRHDLWFPGYLWADTACLWRPSGLEYHDGMEGYTLSHPPLLAVFERLQQLETQPGFWLLGGDETAPRQLLMSQFPLVGRFADEEGRSTNSGLSPEVVQSELGAVFR